MQLYAMFACRQKLEAIVWPHVKVEIQKRIDEIKKQWQKGGKTAKNAIVILEAAVLLDAEWGDILDGIWVVKAERKVALNRLIQTRGLSEEEVGKNSAYLMLAGRPFCDLLSVVYFYPTYV
jgi:dephospho-CoA kinase